MTTRLAPLLAIATLAAACGKADEGVTYADAREGVDESLASTSASLVTDDTIELSTNFTLGKAAQAAAEELRDWIASQIPCSTVTLAGETVTVDFGTLDDACSYNGHTFAGTWAITVNRTDPGEAQVHHAWTNVTNGLATVNGTADVTWSASAHTRHVVHSLTWSWKDRSYSGSGDRVQQLIDPAQGLTAGIRVDGTREWTRSGGAGPWTLDIDGVELRGQDPVPQAGTYLLTSPRGKALTLSFTRVDEDTIRVTVAGPKRSFSFQVSKQGTVNDA